MRLARPLLFGEPMRRFLTFTFAAVVAFAAALDGACGTSSEPATNNSPGACPAGTTFCEACAGDGVCSAAACSALHCADGASDAATADATFGTDAGACGPGESVCIACGGTRYCSAGGCPGFTCPGL